MATKVFDGFDHYNVLADLVARSGFLQWQMIQTGAISGPTPDFQTGRNGIGKCVHVNGNSNSAARLIGVFADRNAEFFCGQAAKLPILVGNGCGLWVFFYDTTVGTNGTVQLTLHFNEVNYSVVAYRGDGLSGGGTVIGTSANNVWANTVWQFHEFHPVIANSGGSIEVRVNNEVVLTVASADTQNSANAWADGIAFAYSPFQNSHAVEYSLDDFYYNDTSSGPGLVPANSYMGDSSVVTLPPIGNDSVTWTPFANTNWQEVSELAMDSDVSYNFTSSVGNEDRFNFRTITAALDTVYALQVTGAYRKDDGGTRTIEQSVKSGATEVYSSGHNIPDTNYAYFTDLWVLNPDTGLNWTKTEINAMKAGYKLTA